MSFKRIPLQFPKSKNDRIRASQAALSLYATDGPVPDLQAPAKRERIPKADYTTATKGSEGQIQNAVLAYLRMHPAVAFVGRFNRGSAVATYNGTRQYIRFCSVPGFADIAGMTKSGRFFALEVKRHDGKLTEDQAAFLTLVRQWGGVASVVRSVEDAQKALAGA